MGFLFRIRKVTSSACFQKCVNSLWSRMDEKPWPILIVAFVVTFALGIGIYTFVYAKGASYLSNDPKACVNCHVMQNHFNAWQKSSHHAVAVCNDCHAPKNIIGKLAVKGINGWNHGSAFTTGDFKEPFQITELNSKVTETSCRTCHSAIVHQIDTKLGGDPISCVRCHSTVGHME